ncbi:MAG: peptide deformylase [Chitinophagales bacterium]|nr:peptide deformylase [Chitinophagales bacterium]
MIIKNNPEAILLNCEEVRESEVGELISLLERELLLSELNGEPGIGLAAPQLGIAKKIAIVRIDNTKINLVNCSIDKYYDPFIFKDEGCLSFPGRVENTKRFQEIVIKNNLVYPKNFIATGLVAVCCQHEIEHFNNKLFFDNKVKENIKIKQKPNDLCNCGSNKKYKKCCGK